MVPPSAPVMMPFALRFGVFLPPARRLPNCDLLFQLGLLHGHVPVFWPEDPLSDRDSGALDGV